jgi:hypothetical protein
MGKESGSRSGMNNPDHISESLETIFWVKILKSFVADPGPGMEKIRIRDVNNSDPGSGINIRGPQHCFHPSPYLIGRRTNHPLLESQVVFRTIIEKKLKK